MRNSFARHLFPTVFGGSLIATGIFLAPINCFLQAVLLMLCAFILYFYISIFVAEKNWWDIRAVFSATWIFTIGLASLRLLGYQRLWETATWIIMAVAYVMFYIGATVSGLWAERVLKYMENKKPVCIGKFIFEFQQNRLFWICFVVTLIGMSCFLINVAIRGYIPYFSDSPTAYLDFYTRFHVFSVASTIVSGLCYYTLKTQRLPVWKRLFLYISILYATFIFPMLVVSRGAFLTSALALTTAVFYLNKRRFLILVLSAIVIVVFFMEGTSARNYTDDYLRDAFEIPETSCSMNPTAAFVYSYFTVSHDNLNEAIRLTEHHTYGARHFMPFNVIFRFDAINRVIENAENHFVKENLNTNNIAGDAYYDFGHIGVLISIFLYAVIFGMIQSFYLRGKGAFALLALGNTMTPVTLCFFASWMSVFSQWLLWGTTFLMFLAASISRRECANKLCETMEGIQ